MHAGVGVADGVLEVELELDELLVLLLVVVLLLYLTRSCSQGSQNGTLSSLEQVLNSGVDPELSVIDTWN